MIFLMTIEVNVTVYGDEERSPDYYPCEYKACTYWGSYNPQCRSCNSFIWVGKDKVKETSPSIMDYFF